jgi:hypothetical protein
MKTQREQLSGKCRHFNSIPIGRCEKSDKCCDAGVCIPIGRCEKSDKCCDAGVCYRDLMRIKELGITGCMLRIPCFGEKVGSVTRGITVEYCEKYSAFTAEDIDAQVAEMEVRMEKFRRCIMRNVSTCCDAPIDESQVIKSGEHKGHGPRFCTNCKKVVFMV